MIGNGSGLSIFQCSGLEFQVWTTRHQSAEGWTGEEDVYIGCAHVDLSTLAYGLGQLCGWYHIMDFGQQIRGQLKVHVDRDEACLIAYFLPDEGPMGRGVCEFMVADQHI